jgi:L-seryl-tRNA(Ser) seleniumtransferase
MLQDELKKISSVDKLLHEPSLANLIDEVGSELVTYSIRLVLETEREKVFNGANATDINGIIREVKRHTHRVTGYNFKPIINATGIILHTNLGRAPLGKELLKEIEPVLSGYSNLEFDLHTGKRGDRTEHIANLLKFITGAEDALIVNNNAAAILLILKTFAEKKEVIISRGELIEIGGSFRIPEIMKSGGAKMVEVGTTNRTHLADYENAITKNTRIIFKVHRSNYFIGGFSKEVELLELSHLAKKHDLLLVYDTGSGLLKKPVFTKHLKEPDVRSGISNGADLVTFSCDKLLGASQAGIIVGKKDLIKQLAKAPLMRALRVDKFAIATIHAILKYYLNEEDLVKKSPVFMMLNRNKKDLRSLAEKLCEMFISQNIKAEIVESKARCGGGALPQLEFDSYSVKILFDQPEKKLADKLFKALLRYEKPVLGILREGEILFDVFTLMENDIPTIVEAFKNKFSSIKQPTN